MAEHAERYRWAEEFHGRFDNRPRPITRWKNPVGKQPQPKAEEVRVEIDDNYLELAEDIGLDSMCVLEEMLKACLKKEKIFVYPTDKAEKYLESKFTNSSQQVVWRPLRKQDINENYPSSTLVRMVYNRAVPGFALQKVKTISEAFTYPSELTFEVSDYEEVKPDPFLSVRIKGSEKRFVVAVWDEPNFRMEELAETTKEKGGEPEQDNSIA